MIFADPQAAVRLREKQVRDVRRRLVLASYGHLVAELYWKIKIDPVFCVDALEAALGYADPVGRVMSLWQAWNGGGEHFPAFVRHHVDGKLGTCKERRR